MRAARPFEPRGEPHTARTRPGVNAYVNHGCRCDECRMAVRVQGARERGFDPLPAAPPRPAGHVWSKRFST